MKALSRNPLFQVRYLPSPPPKATVCIIDEKGAFVTISATANLADTSALWSDNECFLAIMQNYFENKWNSAVPLHRVERAFVGDAGVF